MCMHAVAIDPLYDKHACSHMHAVTCMQPQSIIAVAGSVAMHASVDLIQYVVQYHFKMTA